MKFPALYRNELMQRWILSSTTYIWERFKQTHNHDYTISVAKFQFLLRLYKNPAGRCRSKYHEPYNIFSRDHIKPEIAFLTSLHVYHRTIIMLLLDSIFKQKPWSFSTVIKVFLYFDVQFDANIFISDNRHTHKSRIRRLFALRGWSRGNCIKKRNAICVFLSVIFSYINQCLFFVHDWTAPCHKKLK